MKMHDLFIGRLEAVAAEAVAALRQTAPGRDWLDEILDADLHEKGDRVPLTEHLNLDLFARVFTHHRN